MGKTEKDYNDFNQMVGSQSIAFEKPSYIQNYSSIAGKKEGEGPLGSMLEKIVEDPMFGQNTWEKAESEMQSMCVSQLLSKSKVAPEEIRYIFAGDLLGQLIGSTFGVCDYDIPFFGLYGACSTMGESISLGAMSVSGGYAHKVIAMASSHFASAEKQFRFPLQYGNQRPLSATWTVTGCGSVLLSDIPSNIKISGITTGKIVDYGVKDSMNMGACMAPAAADVIEANLKDFHRNPNEYDMIFTGDLGMVGKRILIDLLRERDIDISANHSDCGLMIFDNEKQDTHSGGSGCACSALVLCNEILPKVAKGEYQRVLFCPTGALLSPVSFNEGNSIPGISHAIVIENC